MDGSRESLAGQQPVLISVASRARVALLCDYITTTLKRDFEHFAPGMQQVNPVAAYKAYEERVECAALARLVAADLGLVPTGPYGYV